jgi:Spy/CpxP family protein refolding chaperone
MKKKVLIISGTVALLALLAVPFAFAQHAGGRHFRGHDESAMFLGHLQKAKAELGLTDQQISDIRAVFQTLREQNQPFRESMHSGMAGIAKTLIADPNNIAAAQALIDQQAVAEKAMKTNMLNAMSKALNVLTPDQRAKLADHIDKRMERMRER